MKNILWLVQSTGLNSYHPHLNVEILNELGYKFKDFGLIPFSKEITNLENILEEDLTYIIRGGTKLLTTLKGISSISEINEFLSKEQIELSDFYLQKLKEGIFYDVEKFDQSFYRHLDLPLLNSDAWVLDYQDVAHLKFERDLFIKPSRDLKAFNGGVLDAGKTVEEYILSQMHQSFYSEEKIVLAGLKKINAEYRFFFVNGKVITGSQYRKNNRFQLSRDIDKKVFDVAQEYASLYQPADIFTLDIADVETDIKETFEIIEYNCFNASGLYHADGVKLFREINGYIRDKND